MTFEKLAHRLRSAEGVEAVDATLVDTALKGLRAAFAKREDPFERRQAICAQIGAATDPAWRKILMELRDAYDESTIAGMVGDINDAFARSAEDGWAAWLRALVEAVLRFRPRYTFDLCAPAFPFDAGRVGQVADLRRAVRCMAQSRWDEVTDAVAWLSAQDVLSAAKRGKRSRSGARPSCASGG